MQPIKRQALIDYHQGKYEPVHIRFYYAFSNHLHRFRSIKERNEFVDAMNQKKSGSCIKLTSDEARKAKYAGGIKQCFNQEN